MEAYEYILKELLKIPNSHETGTKDQIRMICPVCNHPKPKLYIGLMNNSKLLGYDCKHCQFQGKVGPQFLEIFNVVCEEYIQDFKDNKKRIKIFNPVTKMEKLNFKIPEHVNPNDEFKLNYLSSRFGRPVTKQDIKTYKIVLNFKEFFEYNDFDYLQFESDPDKRKYLQYLATEYSEHFVGLLSVDNNKINLRNINSQNLSTKRYMVHVINKDIVNPYMYMPDIPIDLCCTDPVINMAEGNYDIIGAKLKYFLNEDYSNIFVAVGTRKAYRRVLNQIMKMTGFLNAKINIFADNDVFNNPDTSFMETEIPFYKEMFKKDFPLFDNINVIYNKEGKDFGNLSKPVRAETIKLN